MTDSKKMVSDTELDMVAGGRRRLIANPENNEANEQDIQIYPANEKDKESVVALKGGFSATANNKEGIVATKPELDKYEWHRFLPIG